MKTTSIALGLLLTLAAATPAHAQVSAFTYQGRLNLNGTPANGHYDFMFRLLNDPTNGVAAPVIPVALAVPVSNGLFTTGMDFGAENFDGANRWLEISVCTNGSGSFTTLSPRQALTPAPYAIQSAFASSSVSVSGPVSAAQLTGTILSDNIGAGSISSVMLAAGAVGPNQLAAGAVTTGALADGAVTAAKVATVSNWFALTIGNPTPAVDDSFGFSMVAVGNDRVLIGAHFDDTGATDAGAAYLFRTNGSLLVTFTNPTPAYNDSFGISVAAVGSDRVLIGAFLDDTGATDAGAAYLFTTNGVLLTTFTNPTAGSLDQFGYPVAAVGDNLVLIGARYDDTTAPNAGAAYLFNFNGRLLTTFTNPTPIAGEAFGVPAVAVGTDRVLIGAYAEYTGALTPGAAYLFITNGLLLTTFTNPTPAMGDKF
ncbi:MAG TPA: FG-GAP repeat protein, partial [Verrucomicrobiae bacterium]